MMQQAELATLDVTLRERTPRLNALVLVGWLCAREAALAAAGIRLIVVTGGLSEGMMTPKLLACMAPGLAVPQHGEIGVAHCR